MYTNARLLLTQIYENLFFYFYSVYKMHSFQNMYSYMYLKIWPRLWVAALYNFALFKGSVKWKKRRDVSGIYRSPFNSSIFSQIKIIILKDPGPLKCIRRIWAVKQQFMCTDRIMWPPGSKILLRSVFSRNRLDSGRTSPAILISKECAGDFWCVILLSSR